VKGIRRCNAMAIHASYHARTVNGRHSARQSDSILRGKAGAVLNAHTELRAKRQHSNARRGRRYTEIGLLLMHTCGLGLSAHRRSSACSQCPPPYLVYRLQRGPHRRVLVPRRRDIKKKHSSRDKSRTYLHASAWGTHMQPPGGYLYLKLVAVAGHRSQPRPPTRRPAGASGSGARAAEHVFPHTNLAEEANRAGASGELIWTRGDAATHPAWPRP